MAGKKRSAGRPWQPMQRATLNVPSAAAAALIERYDVQRPREVWKNDRYTVLVYDWPGGMTELSIRRDDHDWPRDWRHFQRIKNEIVGPESEACELYPAESRLLDGANQFHLWVLPPGMHFPFGYMARSVAGQDHPAVAGIGGKQRPLEEVS